MKSTGATAEMANFNAALRQVMQVSKTDLNALLKDEKAIEGVRQKRGPRPKTSASGRASRDKYQEGSGGGSSSQLQAHQKYWPFDRMSMVGRPAATLGLERFFLTPGC